MLQHWKVSLVWFSCEELLGYFSKLWHKEDISLDISSIFIFFRIPVLSAAPSKAHFFGLLQRNTLGHLGLFSKLRTSTTCNVLGHLLCQYIEYWLKFKSNLIIFGFDDTVINFHVLYLYVLTRGLLYYVPYCENILTEVSIIQFSCKGIF